MRTAPAKKASRWRHFDLPRDIERVAPRLLLHDEQQLGSVVDHRVYGGNKPGHEIEYPMAVVILGGLITSTVLNLVLLPALYLRFGKRRA